MGPVQKNQSTSDPRHLKTRKQGNTTLTYCPWNTIARHLHHRAPGWCWEVQSVQEVGGAVVVTGRLTIPTADGDLLHYSAVASEPLESASKAPAAEVAASSCLRRAAASPGFRKDVTPLVSTPGGLRT